MSVTTHMEKGFQSWSHPTYDEIEYACKHIANFASFNPALKNIDLIVGVARGGLFPAVILSHMLNIPMKVIHYSSKEGKGDGKNHANTLPELPGKKILFVEDLVDSGATLKEITEHYNKTHTVHSAVIYYKETEEQLHIPDIYAVKVSKNFGWITFPFEQ